MRYLCAQVLEIRRDASLLWFGAALSLVNALTAFHWLTRQPAAAILSPEMPPVCWPFVPDCASLRILSSDQVAAVLWTLLVLAIVNACVFLHARHVLVAYGLFVLLTALKTLILLQDYRLILNQHYMANWVSLSYLFVSNKRRTLPCLLVLFYVWAGLLKLNNTWMSGAALYGLRPLGLSPALIPAACLYVIVLELVVVWGVLASGPQWFWLSFLQLILFHVSSFWVVGAFYPVLMFLLLTIVPLVRYIPGPHPENVRSSTISSLVSGQEPRQTYAVAIALSLAQIVPPLVFPGDSAITGEGRMFALHMFDAPVECAAIATVRTAAGEIHERLTAPFVHNRIACDPLVYLNIARNYCQTLPDRSDDLDFVLKSRRTGEALFQKVVDLKSVCREPPHYSPWHHNPWILAYGNAPPWIDAQRR